MTLVTTLRERQRAGADFALARKGSLIAARVGKGKTLTALAVADRSEARTVLVLCPLAVVGVWRREVAKHCPGSFRVVVLDRGTCADKAAATRQELALSAARRERIMLVVNYDAAWRAELGKALLGKIWDLIIFDELHRLKAPAGVASTWATKLAKIAKRRLGLTGTPAPHSPLDIYSQFRVLDASVFGPSYTAFRCRYGAIKLIPGAQKIWHSMPIVKWVQRFVPRHFPGASWVKWIDEASIENPAIGAYAQKAKMVDWLVHPERMIDKNEVLNWLKEHVWITATDMSDVDLWPNQKEFRERFLRVAFEDMDAGDLDLPPVTSQVVPVTLEPKALRIYGQMEREFYAEVDRGEVTASNALVKILRLQQIASGVLPLDNGETEQVSVAKRMALADLIEDLEAPFVVFGKFHSDLDTTAAVASAAGQTYHEVSGRLKDLTPHATMLDDTDVLGVQVQSGGLGIDLTRASLGIFYSLTHSLGDYEQCQGRLHRPGQKQHTHFLHLVATGTVDETIMAALDAKKSVIEAVVYGRAKEKKAA